MADFYMDTDAGSDANNGTTWALAKLTFEGLLAVMSAGDSGWVQGAAADNLAANRTFASPGTITNPCIILGVIDGTTNEPPALADLASTLPIISNSGAGADMTFTGFTSYISILIISIDRITLPTISAVKLINGRTNFGGRIIIQNNSLMMLENSIANLTTTGSALDPVNSGEFSMIGGSVIFDATVNMVRGTASGLIKFKDVNLEDLNSAIVGDDGGGAAVVIKNCKMPATFDNFDTTPSDTFSSITVISSSNTTSQAATSSIQDYQYEDAHGTIDLETTIVRTGGSDDDASGLFSHAMTPHANATLEGTQAALKSEEMEIWVQAGSQTVTVYIANDGAGDLLEDEIYCRFSVPSATDLAQDDLTFVTGDARLFPSSTAVADDTGSTWGGGVGNHQKFVLAINPGFEGPLKAQVFLLKRQATPDTVFIDMKPEVV